MEALYGMVDIEDIMDWVSADILVLGILKVEDATGSGDETLSGEFMKSNEMLLYATRRFASIDVRPFFVCRIPYVLI